MTENQIKGKDLINMTEEQLKRIIVMFGLDGQVEWENAGLNAIKVKNGDQSFTIIIQEDEQ